MKYKTRQTLLNGLTAMWMLILLIGLLMALDYASTNKNEISTYSQRIESKEVITIEVSDND